MKLYLCKHLCFIVLVQLCFYILCVSLESTTVHTRTHDGHSVNVHSTSNKPTPIHHTATTIPSHKHSTPRSTSPHSVRTTTTSSSLHTHHTLRSGSPHPAHPTHHFGNEYPHKANNFTKGIDHKHKTKYNHFAKPPANMSSDELYVDPDPSAEQTSESASYEIMYANETDNKANLTYWLNLDDAFEILLEKKYDHMSSVHVLANAYKFFARKKRFRSLPYGRQNVFITIEGIDKEMRITLAEHLTELLEGKLVMNPTVDFFTVSKDFGNNTELQRAFTSVTTYIAAKNVRKTIESTIAVVPGFYLTDAAFLASQIYFPHLPPKNSSFWTWPEDLFKPDMIFYLLSDVDLNPNEELNPEALVIKNSMMQIFTLWEDPPCFAIQNKLNYSLMLEEMIPHLNTIL